MSQIFRNCPLITDDYFTSPDSKRIFAELPTAQQQILETGLANAKRYLEAMAQSREELREYLVKGFSRFQLNLQLNQEEQGTEPKVYIMMQCVEWPPREQEGPDNEYEECRSRMGMYMYQVGLKYKSPTRG